MELTHEPAIANVNRLSVDKGVNTVSSDRFKLFDLFLTLLSE
jgi:hypothetical protein